MTPAATPGIALRRAALMLYGMAPMDQAWVLARLSPRRRDCLQRLLRELCDLGIPVDASLLPQAEAGSTALSAVERLQALNAAEVNWLAGRLLQEPAELTALLLSHRAWPWQAALLERVDEERRQCVAAASSRTHGSLPQAALIEALVRMLPTAIAAPPVSLAVRAFSRLLRMRTQAVSRT